MKPVVEDHGDEVGEGTLDHLLLLVFMDGVGMAGRSGKKS